MTRATTVKRFALSNLKLAGLNSKTVIIITTSNLGLATEIPVAKPYQIGCLKRCIHSKADKKVVFLFIMASNIINTIFRI